MVCLNIGFKASYAALGFTPANVWSRPATTIRGLYLTGQDVATDGVIGALVGSTLCASVILRRDLMAEIRGKA